MVSPHALRSVDQFQGTKDTENGLVAVFSYPARMAAHCGGEVKPTFDLTADEVSAKMAHTENGSLLAGERREAQLEHYRAALQRLQR